MFPTLVVPEFPSWAKPGPFTKRTECQLAEGERWPNGEVAYGNLHPRGWGGDQQVVPDGGGGYHMWLNWPDWTSIQTGTRIAYSHSSDGVRWLIPQVVLDQDANEASGRGIIGTETPSSVRMPGGWWLHAALVKVRQPDGSRLDEIRFYRTVEPGGRWEPLPDSFTLRPKLENPWEGQFISKSTGNKLGGRMEPALMRTGHHLFCGWTNNYYGGYQGVQIRPSTGIAAMSLDGSMGAWYEWPVPVILNSGQIHLSEVTHHDEVVGTPMSGFLATYQHNPGTPNTAIHCRYSENLVHWSDPITLLDRGEQGQGTSARIVGPCLLPEEGKLYVWGKEEGEKDSHIVLAEAEA